MPSKKKQKKYKLYYIYIYIYQKLERKLESNLNQFEPTKGKFGFREGELGGKQRFVMVMVTIINPKKGFQKVCGIKVDAID